MKPDIPTTLRRIPYVPGLYEFRHAAELCQMLRAEFDGPSTFHWASDGSPCLDQVSNATFVAL